MRTPWQKGGASPSDWVEILYLLIWLFLREQHDIPTLHENGIDLNQMHNASRRPSGPFYNY